MSSKVLDRVARRETHSPRTAAAVAVLVVAAVLSLFVGTEIVLWLSGLPPLLVAPGAAARSLTDPTAVQAVPAVVAGGVIVALVGVVLWVLALAPGRRPRHRLGGPHPAVVVDNGVIASAVAERIRRELDLQKGDVVVGVGHRSADITIRPEVGQTVDKAQVRSLAQAEIDDYAPSPRVRARVRVRRAEVSEGTV